MLIPLRFHARGCQGLSRTQARRVARVSVPKLPVEPSSVVVQASGDSGEANSAHQPVLGPQTLAQLSSILPSITVSRV